MASRAGSATVPGSRVTTPLTATRPSRMSWSAPRRDVSPACARILLSLSFAMASGGCRQVGRQIRDHQLALDLRQVVEIAQAERHHELARRLVEEGPAGRLLAAADADEAPLEQVLEDGVGVHAAHGVELGLRHRLLVGDDG